MLERLQVALAFDIEAAHEVLDELYASLAVRHHKNSYYRRDYTTLNAGRPVYRLNYALCRDRRCHAITRASSQRRFITRYKLHAGLVL